MWKHAPSDQILPTNHNIVLKQQHLPTVHSSEKRKQINHMFICWWVTTGLLCTALKPLSPLQSKELQLDIIPASAPGSEVKLRDAAHELNEEKRKSARRKE